MPYVSSVGRYQPRCGGRCLVANVSEDNFSNVSFVLILIPYGLWMLYVAPHLWDSVTTTLPIVGVFLFICSVVFLYCARCTEPGILPTQDVEGQTTVGGYAKKVVVLDSKTYELERFRAKFVRETGNVVERFDHFCPWVGNAVGIRNYRFFVLFLTATNLLALLVLLTTVLTVTSKSADSRTGGFSGYMDAHTGHALVMVGLLVYVSVILLCVGGLWFYHVQLICSNKTTNEDIKQILALDNQYDQGCCSNCAEILCSPVRGSYFVAEPGRSVAAEAPGP